MAEKEWSNMPGFNPLWVLKFKDVAEGSARRAVDLLIPSPDPNSPEWIIAGDRVNQETLEALLAVQRACIKIKKECIEEINTKIDETNPAECERKSKRLKEKAYMLQELTKQFQQILKKFNSSSD